MGKEERREIGQCCFTDIGAYKVLYYLFLLLCHVSATSTETAIQTTLGPYLLHWFWELRDVSYLVLLFKVEFQTR